MQNILQIGDRIKLLRKERDMTQKELGNHLHITEQAISKWERKEATPDIEKITLLSNIFSVSCDYLLTGKDIEKLVYESLWEQIVIQNDLTTVKKMIKSSYKKEEIHNVIEGRDTYGNHFLHYVLEHRNYEMLKLILDDQKHRLDIRFGIGDYKHESKRYWSIDKTHHHYFSHSDSVKYKYLDSGMGLFSVSIALSMSIENNDLSMFDELFHIHMNTSREKNNDSILLDESIKKTILLNPIKQEILKRIGINTLFYETTKGYEVKKTPRRLVEYLRYIIENNGTQNHKKIVKLIFEGSHDYTFEYNTNSGFIKQIYELANINNNKFDLKKYLSNNYGDIK